MKPLLLFILVFLSFQVNSQILYYQDIFHGGVTGDGYTSGNLNSTDTILISLDSSSSVRKAFLFVHCAQTTDGNPMDRIFNFNGYEIKAFFKDRILDFNVTNQFIEGILVFDVSSLISCANEQYLITAPFGQELSPVNTIYFQYYLYVCYENPLLPVISTSVHLNKMDSQATINLALTSLNTVNLTADVGLSFVGHSMCDISSDGSYLSINNFPVGLIGGDESTTELGCSGVRGSFCYRNNQLFGLGNDTPDSLVNGIDALCNIRTYLNATDHLNASFIYQDPNTFLVSTQTNPIFELFTAYSTPCDTFSVALPSDTVICQGVTLPLHVSGGNRVEWSPAIGLSCYDCYDPIFVGDSSQHYFIRFWNSDSCSVVRPLHIGVDPLPSFGGVDITPSNCGTSNGELNVEAAPSSQGPFSYAWNGTATQSSNVFTNLPEGANHVSVTDRFGCSHDTTVLIPEINPTTAAFTIDPSTGMAPLEVNITNLSNASTHFSWLLNNQNVGNSLSSFVCDTSGNYTITLIAWQYDPSCADTTSLSIAVSPGIIIPTAFTPDNDQVNDVWDILFLDQNYPNNKVFVYDRWGQLVYESYPGFYYLHPWNGAYKGEALPVGSYYYIIQFNDEASDERKGVVSIVRE